LEIGWTVIPTIIVVALWWLGYQEHKKIDLGSVMAGNMPENALHVKVMGQQWAWSFEYPGLAANATFGEIRSSELVLPVGRKAFFEIDSVDVNHSFWIPEMRLKMDAIPGRTTYLVLTPDRPGEYKVRCAEICGSEHASMLAPVRVVSAEEFDRFIQDSDVGSLEPAARGERWARLYGCTACHSVDGSALVGPTWEGLWGSERVFTDGSRRVADEEYLRNAILDPGDEILEGFLNVMPANFADRFEQDFGAVDLPIGDLVEYIKTLNGDD
jgi:cytochrome c oxidase subunit 2